MNEQTGVTASIQERFGQDQIIVQPTCDGITTLWVPFAKAPEILRYLKEGISEPFRVLYDLTAIDERTRSHRQGQPESDFTVVYHLLSYERNADIRIKTALEEDRLSVPSITGLWPSADWYEREAWDMFGIRFEGHPRLRRILMPATWKGHPLRKDHPARATEMGPFELPEAKLDAEEEALQFRPEDWGLTRYGAGTEFMFLNLGPQHPGTHGPLRIVLELDGEEIRQAVPDIGFHHRGAEKMGERQSWHTYIPYTDRIDYLSGVMNNFPYVLAVEQLAGITVPDRARVIRIMMAELFRIISHLVWYGTFALDLGAMSPVFYTFNDRERAFHIVEAVCGGRMHPAWFRIGGVAQDLPRGWDRLIREFLDYFPKRLAEYDGMIMRNRILKARTKGVGVCTLDEAVEWGITGSNGISARNDLTRATTRWSSRSRRRRAATATRGPSSAPRRCTRACASSDSAWRTCPRVLTNRITPLPPRR